jgi:hypothetical protein
MTFRIEKVIVLSGVAEELLNWLSTTATLLPGELSSEDD